ncbi:hypothetical protein PRIPAC_88799 [Pristionchus pacificus]|uniref:Secreted protein n=1 Tax=Pristionchus pacificus TaxID=54126 RepID=A0A8R1UBV3_PRIPA|nr:hypothetical protein PRIPAC_88799 [Pristionchus pacificus]|eukprot:PDM83384.1 hypothetical protein PRIPAC_35016 [Pristionchus pacificus]
MRLVMTANWVLCAAAMVVASLAVVYGNEEMGGGEITALQMGKPCEAAFDCWRSEPVDVASGLPLRMSQSFRQKRLEVGGGRTKGGRCRCTLGTCQLYQFSTKSFVPCEEF